MSAGGRLVPLTGADWADDAPGIRARAIEGVDRRRFAIVEYGPRAARTDWCLDGHYGLVLEGEIEYHFDDGSPPLRIAAGDALWLVGGGPAHQGHNVADGATTLFLIDPVCGGGVGEEGRATGGEGGRRAGRSAARPLGRMVSVNCLSRQCRCTSPPTRDTFSVTLTPCPSHTCRRSTRHAACRPSNRCARSAWSARAGGRARWSSGTACVSTSARGMRRGSSRRGAAGGTSC
jgi:hypothetical protein